MLPLLSRVSHTVETSIHGRAADTDGNKKKPPPRSGNGLLIGCCARADCHDASAGIDVHGWCAICFWQHLHCTIRAAIGSASSSPHPAERSTFSDSKDFASLLMDQSCWAECPAPSIIQLHASMTCMQIASPRILLKSGQDNLQAFSSDGRGSTNRGSLQQQSVEDSTWCRITPDSF